MGRIVLNKEDVSRIWAAVLLQACKDIVAPFDHKKGSKESIRRKALAWVMSTRNDTNSFINICNSLGFDHDHVRAVMLSLPKDIQNDKVRTNSFLAAGDYRG